MDSTAGQEAGTRPMRSRAQRVARALALLALVAVAVPAVARFTGWEAGPLAIAVALMPWVTFAALVPLVLSLLARAWILACASAAVVALCAAWILPLFIAESAPDGGDELTVASLNLTFGRANAYAVVQWVEEFDIDVLSAQEVTPEIVDALAMAGLDDLMPYSEVAAEPGVTGTALWSRLPLSATATLDGFTGPESRDGYASRAVRGDIAVAGTTVSVLAVHPAAPGLTDHSGWRASMRGLTTYLADQEGPMLVLGDFNTTRDHRAFRDIQALGFVDAADQAGAGFLPTFPQGRRAFPVAAIDHAMVRDAPMTATDVHTVVIPGADHKGLIVTYATE